MKFAVLTSTPYKYNTNDFFVLKTAIEYKYLYSEGSAEEYKYIFVGRRQ